MNGPKVLVVDDDPGVRFTIQFLLEDAGFEVVLAENGEKALELARSEDPDAILLDNLMPKLDGPEVLRALRAGARTKDIPVLALTGTSQEGIGEWAEAEHLQKPFAPDALVSRVKALLVAGHRS